MTMSKSERRKKLLTMCDDDIDFSDIPELGDDFWAHAKVIMPATPAKKQISIKIDRDVLDFFRKDGPGYQTRMNAVLKSFMRASRDQGST